MSLSFPSNLDAVAASQLQQQIHSTSQRPSFADDTATATFMSQSDSRSSQHRHYHRASLNNINDPSAGSSSSALNALGYGLPLVRNATARGAVVSAAAAASDFHPPTTFTDGRGFTAAARTPSAGKNMSATPKNLAAVMNAVATASNSMSSSSSLTGLQNAGVGGGAASSAMLVASTTSATFHQIIHQIQQMENEEAMRKASLRFAEIAPKRAQLIEELAEGEAVLQRVQRSKLERALSARIAYETGVVRRLADADQSQHIFQFQPSEICDDAEHRGARSPAVMAMAAEAQRQKQQRERDLWLEHPNRMKEPKLLARRFWEKLEALKEEEREAARQKDVKRAREAQQRQHELAQRKLNELTRRKQRQQQNQRRNERGDARQGDGNIESISEAAQQQSATSSSSAVLSHYDQVRAVALRRTSVSTAAAANATSPLSPENQLPLPPKQQRKRRGENHKEKKSEKKQQMASSQPENSGVGRSTGGTSPRSTALRLANMSATGARLDGSIRPSDHHHHRQYSPSSMTAAGMLSSGGDERVVKNAAEGGEEEEKADEDDRASSSCSSTSSSSSTGSEMDAFHFEGDSDDEVNGEGGGASARDKEAEAAAVSQHPPLSGGVGEDHEEPTHRTPSQLIEDEWFKGLRRSISSLSSSASARRNSRPSSSSARMVPISNGGGVGEGFSQSMGVGGDVSAQQPDLRPATNARRVSLRSRLSPAHGLRSIKLKPEMLLQPADPMPLHSENEGGAAVKDAEDDSYAKEEAYYEAAYGRTSGGASRPSSASLPSPFANMTSKSIADQLPLLSHVATTSPTNTTGEDGSAATHQRRASRSLRDVKTDVINVHAFSPERRMSAGSGCGGDGRSPQKLSPLARLQQQQAVGGDGKLPRRPNTTGSAASINGGANNPPKRSVRVNTIESQATFMRRPATAMELVRHYRQRLSELETSRELTDAAVMQQRLQERGLVLRRRNTKKNGEDGEDVLSSDGMGSEDEQQKQNQPTVEKLWVDDWEKEMSLYDRAAKLNLRAVGLEEKWWRFRKQLERQARANPLPLDPQPEVTKASAAAITRDHTDYITIKSYQRAHTPHIKLRSAEQLKAMRPLERPDSVKLHIRQQRIEALRQQRRAERLRQREAARAEERAAKQKEMQEAREARRADRAARREAWRKQQAELLTQPQQTEVSQEHELHSSRDSHEEGTEVAIAAAAAAAVATPRSPLPLAEGDAAVLGSTASSVVPCSLGATTTAANHQLTALALLTTSSQPSFSAAEGAAIENADVTVATSQQQPTASNAAEEERVAAAEVNETVILAPLAAAPTKEGDEEKETKTDEKSAHPAASAAAAAPSSLLEEPSSDSSSEEDDDADAFFDTDDAADDNDDDTSTADEDEESLLDALLEEEDEEHVDMASLIDQILFGDVPPLHSLAKMPSAEERVAALAPFSASELLLGGAAVHAASPHQTEDSCTNNRLVIGDDGDTENECKDPATRPSTVTAKEDKGAEGEDATRDFPPPPRTAPSPVRPPPATSSGDTSKQSITNTSSSPSPSRSRRPNTSQMSLRELRRHFESQLPKSHLSSSNQGASGAQQQQPSTTVRASSAIRAMDKAAVIRSTYRGTDVEGAGGDPSSSSARAVDDDSAFMTATMALESTMPSRNHLRHHNHNSAEAGLSSNAVVIAGPPPLEKLMPFVEEVGNALTAKAADLLKSLDVRNRCARTIQRFAHKYILDPIRWVEAMAAEERQRQRLRTNNNTNGAKSHPPQNTDGALQDDDGAYYTNYDGVIRDDNGESMISSRADDDIFSVAIVPPRSLQQRQPPQSAGGGGVNAPVSSRLLTHSINASSRPNTALSISSSSSAFGGNRSPPSQSVTPRQQRRDISPTAAAASSSSRPPLAYQQQGGGVSPAFRHLPPLAPPSSVVTTTAIKRQRRREGEGMGSDAGGARNDKRVDGIDDEFEFTNNGDYDANSFREALTDAGDHGDNVLVANKDGEKSAAIGDGEEGHFFGDESMSATEGLRSLLNSSGATARGGIGSPHTRTLAPLKVGSAALKRHQQQLNASTNSNNSVGSAQHYSPAATAEKGILLQQKRPATGQRLKWA